MATTVEFCQLDAKDDPYTGYNTVGFVENGEPVPGGPLRIMMEREYLTRLYALQQEIKAKYEALYVPFPHDEEGPDLDWDGCGDSKSYEAAEEAAKEAFPGPTAEYYT